MFAEVPGIVQSGNVTLGDVVNAGDVLVQVSTEQTSNGVRIGTASLDGLRRERGSLEQRRVFVVQAAELARTRHDAQLVALSRQIESSREARSLAEQRVTLAEERLESVRRLQSEGASSREEARIREEALIAQQQQLADLRERTSALEESVTPARLDRKRVDDDLEIQIADLNSRAAQLDLQLAQMLGQVGYSIVAPASGRIAALQVASGDRVDASRPVLTILPEGVPLVAELALPSRVVAQLAIGQRVQLGFDFASASERDHVAGSV